MFSPSTAHHEPGDYQVSARALWAALDLAALAGVPLDGVFDALPFDGTSVRLRRTVDWSDFCVACERLEVACGGAEACERLLASSYHRVLPELRAVAGALTSPMTFARVMIEDVSSLVYSGCSFAMQRTAADRARFELRLRRGARPSLTFFRATVGELRALPLHLGLEAATVLEFDVGPTHGDYDVLFPPSRSLPARARRAGRGVLRMILGRDTEGQPLMLSLGGAETEHELDARVEHAALSWQLTPRQVAVLTHVAQGASNKEISRALECAENTVELHVTQLLKKAGVTSRGRLMARFWSGV